MEETLALCLFAPDYAGSPHDEMYSRGLQPVV